MCNSVIVFPDKYCELLTTGTNFDCGMAQCLPTSTTTKMVPPVVIGHDEIRTSSGTFTYPWWLLPALLVCCCLVLLSAAAGMLWALFKPKRGKRSALGHSRLERMHSAESDDLYFETDRSLQDGSMMSVPAQEYDLLTVSPEGYDVRPGMPLSPPPAPLSSVRVEPIQQVALQALPTGQTVPASTSQTQRLPYVDSLAYVQNTEPIANSHRVALAHPQGQPQVTAGAAPAVSQRPVERLASVPAPMEPMAHPSRTQPRMVQPPMVQPHMAQPPMEPVAQPLSQTRFQQPQQMDQSRQMLEMQLLEQRRQMEQMQEQMQHMQNMQNMQSQLNQPLHMQTQQIQPPVFPQPQLGQMLPMTPVTQTPPQPDDEYDLVTLTPQGYEVRHMDG